MTVKESTQSTGQRDQSKRKTIEHEDAPPVKKKATEAALLRPVQPACPIGLIWDNINYNCAYKVFFTPLACVWMDHPGI
jgi:hypothetical protein